MTSCGVHLIRPKYWRNKMSVATPSPESATSWSCPRCTLLNGVDAARCRVCDFVNPSATSAKNFLQKLTSFIAAPLEKLDLALDLVSSQIYSPRSSTAFSVTAGWSCPQCGRVNEPRLRLCHCCNYDSNTDSQYMTWTCERCALKQPQPPPNARCPLCRAKSSRRVSPLQRQYSASMSNLANIDTSTSPRSSFGAFGASSHAPAASTSHNDPLADAFVPKTSKLYNDIIHFCKLNSQCFVDDAFPHSTRSIGALDQLERADVEIVWLRPSEIVTRDGFTARWSVFNDPRPTDIEQGALGNCWFLSALAVVAERSDILEKIVITKEYNHFGVYEIRLCVDGLWRSVIVDDFFPCHKSTRTMVFAVGRKNQLWVSLIEKALAKIYGNYTLLRAGRTVEGLSTLTGAPSQIVDLELLGDDKNSAENAPMAARDNEAPFAAERLAALDLIWAQLLSAREARFLMGCSCGAGKRPVNEAEFCRVGLMPRHAYSILDVQQLNECRLVRLRNPWGTFAWLGEWSSGWPDWNTISPAIRHRLLGANASPAAASAGTFWMPFDAFVRYFDSVDIAQIRDHVGWTDARYKLDVGWQVGATKAIRLIITEPTEIAVTCFQRNARTLLDQVDVMVAAFHERSPPPSVDFAGTNNTEGDAPFPGALVARSPRRIQASVRTDDVFLAPGVYVVAAMSFAKFAEAGSVPATIVVHSAKRIFTEMLSVRLEFLQHSLSSIILKEGKPQQSLDGCVVRYLTHDFAGFSIMVENYNTNRCVQISSDCTNSMNVLSSRCALLTVDSIPPMHRQIVVVLTHFEPSQSFMIGHRMFQRLASFAQLRDLAPHSPDTQSAPALTTPAAVALHAPTPIFNAQ